MARPIREDYPGAWHHVMNRGRNRDKIFMNDDDAIGFLDAVGDTVERFDIEVHGFSIMPNLYHLLVRSRLGNLRGNPERRFAVWALKRSTYLTYREIGELLEMTAQHVARDIRRSRIGIEGFDQWTNVWMERFPSKVSIV